MLRESKGLKDSDLSLPNLPLHRGRSEEGVLSYTRTSKLITALYMVTDTINNDEPLRNKLRTLGIEIMSDIYMAPINALTRISQIMSLLDIASSVNVISEMNCGILRKEFLQLSQSIEDFAGKDKIAISRPVDLSEFSFESPLLDKEGVGGGNSLITTSPFGHSSSTRRREISKGLTRIGVQRGGTLMKALKEAGVSDKNGGTVGFNHFALLKGQRRNDIINIIKAIGGSATIKDIKDKVQAKPDISPLFAASSEKTLQRELISMVKNSVLNKTGEKRWSRYYLK